MDRTNIVKRLIYTDGITMVSNNEDRVVFAVTDLDTDVWKVLLNVEQDFEVKHVRGQVNIYLYF